MEQEKYIFFNLAVDGVGSGRYNNTPAAMGRKLLNAATQAKCSKHRPADIRESKEYLGTGDKYNSYMVTYNIYRTNHRTNNT